MAITELFLAKRKREIRELQESLSNIEYLESKLRQQLSEAEQLELHAWEQWYASCESRLYPTASGIKPGERHDKRGDPGYLKLVLSCIKLRCQLLEIE